MSFGIIERLKGRGLAAIARRAVRELHAPETPLGRAAAPVTAPLWRVFSAARRAARPPAAAGQALRTDAMTLFYDLDVAPITYDFVSTLALAEAERRARGLARLDVVFVPGRKDGLRAELLAYERAVTPEQRRWRIANMLMPLLALAPGCAGVTVAATRAEAAAIHAACGDRVLPAGYDPDFPVPPQSRDAPRRAAEGLELKTLATPTQALAYAQQWIDAHAAGRRLLTVTLRDYGFMPDRNSNVAAWSDFARGLDRDRYCVAIVPDTEMAMRPPRGEFAEFPHFTAACWNVALRSALYELAWLNLGSSGGAMTLGWFNPKIRYVMCKILVEGVPQASESFVAERGYRHGAQPAFCGPFQKWVWEPDDLPVIRREFAAMEAALQARST